MTDLVLQLIFISFFFCFLVRKSHGIQHVIMISNHVQCSGFKNISKMQGLRAVRIQRAFQTFHLTCANNLLQLFFFISYLTRHFFSTLRMKLLFCFGIFFSCNSNSLCTPLKGLCFRLQVIYLLAHFLHCCVSVKEI